MMEALLTPENLIALLTLTLLEIVLGVDNIIFISIVSNKLEESKQGRARFIGITLALVNRVVLLFFLSYLMAIQEPLFTVFDHPFSLRDVILLAGGLFLLFKSTKEIHEKMEVEGEDAKQIAKASFTSVIVQIILIDIIFSVDSILTAIGLTKELWLMITAVIISMVIMLLFASRIADVIKNHPSLEVLALSFLILIGFMLMVEAFHYEVPKGYIYFAVFFSLLVEMINIQITKRKRVVKLNKRIEEN
jgi:predicted tellurium resistance membrane protein TerC